MEESLVINLSFIRSALTVLRVYFFARVQSLVIFEEAGDLAAELFDHLPRLLRLEMTVAGLAIAVKIVRVGKSENIDDPLSLQILTFLDVIFQGCDLQLIVDEQLPELGLAHPEISGLSIVDPG